MRKKKTCIIMILLIFLLVIIAKGAWEVFDPMGNNTSPARVIYIADNKYMLNRNEEALTVEMIEEEIGQIKRKVRFSVDKNGESNHLKKGTKIFKIKDVMIEEKVAVYYEGNYYEYIDSPWD